MNVSEIKNAMMTMTQTELSQIMNIAQQIKAISEDITIYRRDGSVGDHLTKLFKDTGGIVIDSEINMRYEKKSRQVVNINNDDFIELKKIFDLYGVSWYEAPGEAEKYGCKLCIICN